MFGNVIGKSGQVYSQVLSVYLVSLFTHKRLRKYNLYQNISSLHNLTLVLNYDIIPWHWNIVGCLKFTPMWDNNINIGHSITALMAQGQMFLHYYDVTMGTIVSQITSLMIVYSAVYSNADQRKHQSSVSLAFVLGIHQWPVNSLHKWPVTRKMFPFDDDIMDSYDISEKPTLPGIFWSKHHKI